MAVLIVALLLLVAGLFLFSIRITDIRVEGNSHYTREEVVDMLFPEETDRITVWCFFKQRFGEKKDLAFIQSYEMNFIGMHSVEVILYEKSIVGCIEYMGSYMYFDKDGIVVESSSEKEPDIPLITGLTFERIALYQELPVPKRAVFEEILNLTQLLKLYEIPAGQIYFDPQNRATLTMADQTDGEGNLRNLAGVKVLLGDRNNMEEKISELKNQIPHLYGLTGVLHLENYSPGSMNPRYVFERE
ncbi:MAG: cell division protein FtsQ [Lachnospiraceae bacterium]|nr:cell division protein FtsQ [Lachnospiraceae bacterium]